MQIESIDQLGNKLLINFPPCRIVSLVPSQTEFLFDIGMNDEIVGVTRFCIHPSDKVRKREQIGGTKKFDIEKIRSLNPDLIIGNKEENYEEGITELSKHFPVWMSDVFTIRDSLDMMTELGRIVNRKGEAENLVNKIENGFASNPGKLKNGKKGRSCAYFIWRKPYMVAAGNTFIDNMLQMFGMKNVFSGLDRYPEIEPQLLVELDPDYIFLSSEPYAFGEKHFNEFKAFAPKAKVILVDGEMFSWYGSRLKMAPAYFADLNSRLVNE